MQTGRKPGWIQLQFWGDDQFGAGPVFKNWNAHRFSL
jgi:hypothetical protein